MPARYGLGSNVNQSLIADGCVIEGEVQNSILFRGVKIAKGAKLKNCVIMQDTCVGTDCNLQNVITDKDVMIQDGRSFMGTDTYPVFISKGSIV
jgi:glucose-1-phosphate adenylyltransferase